MISAVWDLVPRRTGVPRWRLLAKMSPGQPVEARDLRYLGDVLTPGQAAQAVPGSRCLRLQTRQTQGRATWTTTFGDVTSLARCSGLKVT